MSRATKWIVGLIAAVVVVLGGSTVAYASYYSERAVPGSKVAGESVSNMTHDQIVQRIEERVSDLTANITVDGKSFEPNLADLGVSVDADATATAVMSQSADAWSRIKGLFDSGDTPAVISLDEGVLDAYAHELIKDLGEPAKNASVKFDEAAEAFVAEPASVGHGLDMDALREYANQAGKNLSGEAAAFESLETEPEITTEHAEQVAASANQMMGIPVVISTGNREITPTAADRAKWVNLLGDDGELSDSALDEAKIKEWLLATAESTNDDPIPGIHNINSRGDVVSTPEEGVPGFYVNNAEDVSTGLIAALKKGEAFEGLFQYDQVEQEFEERLIADGAEDLPYQAAPGEKWIDINLSNATTSAYEGATIVRGPVPMVPGEPGTETVTGVFKVYLQYEVQTMRGLNQDGTTYETPNVPWVTYFHGSYALHGAPWRSSFGWNGPGGSHGCVNMPVGEAKWFYDFVEMGTTVVSHY
ncbi:MAG: L,D-transpeptidase family protein [Actinomycetaceae bacterium]|nr:L,D-transpeptidase family protein [Actinomycetaceae bacterium]